MEVKTLEDPNYMYMGTEPLVDPTYPSEVAVSSPSGQAPYVYITAENSSTVIRRVVSASSVQERTISMPGENIPSVIRRAPSVSVPEPTENFSHTSAEASDDDVVIIGESAGPSSGRKRKSANIKVRSDLYENTPSVSSGDRSEASTHRTCCHKCGHTFEESCIRWWLMAVNAPFGRCPRCNAKARVRDIRPLFNRALRDLDSPEHDRLLEQLEFVSDDRENVKLNIKNLHIIYRKYDKSFSGCMRELSYTQNTRKKRTGPVVSSRPRTDELPADTNTTPVTLEGIGRDDCLFSPVSTVEIARDGGSRVMDYFSSLNQLTVSQRSKYRFFSGYGVKLIDTEEMRAVQFIPAHLKPIKDMAFGRTSSSPSLLLSVSHDCTARLLDVAGYSNPILATISTGTPLWSCCWDACNPNLFHVGSQGGVILSYDVRLTSRPVFRQTDPADASPIISLASIPPSSGRSLPVGGLMSCHASNCWVHDHAFNEIRRINLEGSFTALRYEPTTQHFLFSAKPSSRYPYARFSVCERALWTDSSEDDVRWGRSRICNPPVQTFLGCTEESVQSRPCIVPIEKDLVVAAYQEGSSTVALWSVATGNRLSTIPVSDDVLDSCSVKVNGETYVALLTEKILTFYKYGYA